jgi:hypothetical protein
MRRLIAGAGLAAAIVTGAHIGSGEQAGAQGLDACDTPVIDETLAGDSSGALREVISGFGEQGDNVTVRIYGPGQFNEPGELYDHVDEAYAECGWDDTHINVAFADNPGRDNDLYDLAIGQQPGMFITDRMIFDAESHLSTDLDDPTTSTQQDFANFLNRLYPYDGVGAPPTIEDEQANENKNENQEPLNIPVVPIAVAGAGIVVLGSIGGRIFASKRLLDIKRHTNQAISEAEHRATQAIEGTDENIVDGAEDILRIVHDDDATIVRESLGKLQAVQAGLAQAKEAFATATQGRSFLPRVGKARPLSWEATSAATTVAELADDLRAKVNDFNGLIASLRDEHLPKSGALIEAAAAKADELTSKGWQLGWVTERLDELREKHQRATEANDNGYISEPATLAAEVSDSAHALQAQLGSFETRHANLVTTYRAQTSSMRQTPKLIDDAKTKLGSAVNTYGAENFANLDPETELTKLLGAQREAYTGLQPLTNTLTDEALEAGETYIAQFDQSVVGIHRLTDQVDERIGVIAQLSKDLPGVYGELGDHLTDELENLEEFGDKTTDETRAKFMLLKAEIEASIQQVQAAKPNLHELSSRQEAQQESLVELATRARAEAVEMGELWADVRQIPDQAWAVLSALKTYAATYRDVSPDTRVAINSMDIPPIEPGETREALREQVALAKRLKQQVEKLKAEAEADVARAERDREEARRAERARQEDREAELRRVRTRTNTSSFPKIGGSSRRSSSPSSSTRHSSGGRPKSSGGGSKRRSGRI